jgi:hypothetical protein
LAIIATTIWAIVFHNHYAGSTMFGDDWLSAVLYGGSPVATAALLAYWPF